MPDGRSPMDLPDSSPAVSVIVPCHGALDELPDLVASLQAQDAPFAWETIFVDNNLTPTERAQLEEAIRSLPRGRVVVEAAPGISPA
ncbi:MAG TPA: glycosyltransferase, partial [Acidimicrobiia bacterium]|nr:glycosyltransferase [Acidimicrobiia bacterium]